MFAVLVAARPREAAVSLLVVVAAAAGCGACGNRRGSDSEAGGSQEGGTADTGPPQDGEGGASDAAGEKDGAKPGGDWFTDPSIWTPVPLAGPCEIFVADVAKAGLPPRVWTSCGLGCAQAPANPGLPTTAKVLVNEGASSGEVADGVAYFRASVGAALVPWDMFHTSRVSDGQTIALARIGGDEHCYRAGGGTAAAFVFPAWNVVKEKGIVAGTFTDKPGSPVVWGKTWLPVGGATQTDVFSWAEGWGAAFDDGTVRVVTSPDAKTMTIIDSMLVLTAWAVGRKGLVVWQAWEPPPKGDYVIHAYTTAGGTVPLVSPAKTVEGLAVDDDRIVWCGVEGEKKYSGAYDTAQIYWTPWATKPGDVVVNEGPMLPIRKGIVQLQTGGGYVATDGCVPVGDAGAQDCWILVVHLPTSKIWRIRHRAGKWFHRVLAVTADEVLLGESDTTGSWAQRIDRLVRLRTANLDELEKAW